MIAVRLRKVVRDLTTRWGRTLLTLVGLSLGLFGVGAVLVAFVVLSNDLGENYRRTNPPHIVLDTGPVDAALRRDLGTVDGVAAIEDRPQYSARIEVAPERWMSLTLFVVDDFTTQRVARFMREDGAWPPPDGELTLERDAGFFLRKPIGTPLRVRLPDGRTIDTRLGARAFDPGQAPSRMEMALYGYVTRATLATWGFEPRRSRLLVSVADAPNGRGMLDARRPRDDGNADNVGATADRLQQRLGAAGVAVNRVTINDALAHPHQFQMDAILVLLAGLAVVSALMCAALIINLVDAILVSEQRAIGVMKAIGARSAQITRDYLVGIGVLGLAAGLLCLPFALRTGRGIASFMAMFLNFELLTPTSPLWLIALVLASSIAIPVLVAARRIARTIRLPVRDALARIDPRQASPFADGFGALLTVVPLLPRIALRTLARKPRRTVLTALTLALGLVFFVTALNLRASLLETVAVVQRSKPHDLAVTLRGAYPVDELERWVAQFPDVARAEFWSVDEATLSADGRTMRNRAPLLSVPPQTAAIVPYVIDGEWLRADRPDGVVVTQRLLAEEPLVRVGGDYDLVIDDRRARVHVIGAVKEFGPSAIYAASALADPLIGHDRRANLVFVTLKESSFGNQRKVGAALEASLVGREWQISRVVTSKLLEAIVRSHLDVIAALLGIIAALALGVGAMGLASSISVSVVERYREIGVLKAIGGRSGALATLFAWEAVFVALLGWLATIAIAPPLSRAISASFGTLVIQYPFDYRAADGSNTAALGVALAIALLASALPIRSALKMTAHRALRAE